MPSIRRKYGFSDEEYKAAQKSIVRYWGQGGIGQIDYAHPAKPGSGPKGAFCKECKHRRHRNGEKVYKKCQLLMMAIANNRENQIKILRKGDQACELFQDWGTDPLKLAIKSAERARRNEKEKEKEDAATQRKLGNINDLSWDCSRQPNDRKHKRLI